MAKKKNKGGRPPKTIKAMLEGWDTWETDLVNFYRAEMPTNAMLVVYLYETTGYMMCEKTFDTKLKEAESAHTNSLEAKFLRTVSYCKTLRKSGLENLLRDMAKGDTPSFGFNALNLMLKNYKEYREDKSTKLEVNADTDKKKFVVKLDRPE